MPRIRTIKPEFCTSEQVVECSTDARLLFVLMWMFCDDAGRHPASIKRLKMECFPGDPYEDSQVRSFVNELIRTGLLIEYQYQQAYYWQVTGWKHQKIDRPTYKHGPLDQNGAPLPIAESSTPPRRAVGENSPPDGSLSESKVIETTRVDSCGLPDTSATPPEHAKGEGKSDDDGSTQYLFPLCGGEEWTLSNEKLSEYRGTFPDLDLDRELRLAAQWLRDHPNRRKTNRGMPAFLGSWLAPAQDQGRAAMGEKHSSRRKVPTFEEAGL